MMELQRLYKSTLEYPLGNETRESSKLLFEFFRNNLCLGQWEVAVACVGQLAKSADYRQIIKATLREIIEKPYGISDYGGSLSSPHHLSWLFLTKYKKLFLEEAETEDLQLLSEDVEFRLVLSELSGSPHVIKELYQYQRHLKKYKSNPAACDAPKYLSAATLTFLKTSFNTNPAVIHTLICAIKAADLKSYRVQNEVLDKLYIDTLQHLLNVIPEGPSESESKDGLSNEIENRVEDENESETKTKSESRCPIKKLYTVLSFFDPEPELNQKYLTMVLTKIIKLCDNSPFGVQRPTILGCLIGRKTNYLVNLFMQLDEDNRREKISMKYGKVQTVSSMKNNILNLSRCLTRSKAWRSFFDLLLQQQQHFLDLILMTSLELIQSQQFSDLAELLSPEEFEPLKPLVVLMGWNQCYNSSHAKQLLTLLNTQQVESSKFGSLNRCCTKLSYQIELIEWCLQKSSSSHSENSSSSQKATDLFQTLESHSVLYVLHHAAKLSSLDEGEVLKLLEKTPNHTETMNGNSSKRIVRFADEDVSDSDENGLTPISLEQERDISVYRSYCALMNAMSAIKVCLDFAFLGLMNPLSKNTRRTSSVASYNSSGRDSSHNDLGELYVTSDIDLGIGDNFKVFYHDNVWSKLEAVKRHLAEIFPLTFRLEILENLFSLLFLTHEDIQENLVSDSDGEEPIAEETKASLNSVDSFNLSMNQSDEENMKNKETVNVSAIPMTNRCDSQTPTLDFDVPFESIFTIDKRATLENQASAESLSLNSENSIKRPLSAVSRCQDDLRRKTARPSLGDSSQQISAGSTHSHSSGKSLFKLGFMSNEYLVRDLLQILRECLFDLETAKFRLAGKEASDTNISDRRSSQTLKIDMETENKLSEVVSCSISQENLKKRTSRLTQFISEAQWRYQLVSHPNIPKQAGQVLLEKLQHDLHSSDEEINYTDSESSKRQKRRVSKIGRKQSLEPGGGETTGSQYTDGGYDSSRQRKPRSSSRRKSQFTTNLTKLHTGIIPSMLASPESLLSLCLKRNQPTQADQVVKMFYMENQPEIAEVSFAAKYTESMKNLQSFGSKSSCEFGATSGSSGRVSMKMLANVAAAGMATASVSNITDELLSHKPLPHLPSPSTLENVPVYFQDFFDAENVPGFIVADLLTTNCKTWELCNSLLEISKSLNKDIGKSDSKQIANLSDFKLLGCQAFLAQLWEMVQFTLTCQSPETTAADKMLAAKIIGSNPDVFFRFSSHPMSVQGCKNLLAASETLKKSTEKAQSVLTERTLSPKPIRERTSPESSFRRQSADSALSLRRASPQSLRKHEQPVIHNAMKVLIHSLEKHVPAEGFISHFIRNVDENSPASRNYLLSLYDHVKELAFLVAECEAKSKDLMAIPYNYFEMLKEGPMSTLGRLIFGKKMPPARLEKVAEKLSLNLTHIIVHSCCPTVSSKHLPPPQCHGHVLPDGRCVLNHCESWSDTPRHPEVAVRNILTRLLQAMRDIAQKNNARGIFTGACAEIMCQTTEFTDIALSTQELKFITLSKLRTREEKICFFGNLQNLLTLHAHLYDTLKSISQSNSDGKSIMETVLQTSGLAYCVGELGVFSLFELKFIINRCGLLPPSRWNKLLQSRLYGLDPVDPWLQFVPPPEPRLLFVTADGSASSPPIQILSPDMVHSQLHQAMKDFLNLTVTIDLAKKQVTIPELLVWYRRDFSSEKEEQFDAPNEGLVNFISTQVTGSTESDLIQLLQLDQVHEFGENIDKSGRKELPFTVRVQSYSTDWQINFDFNTLKKGSHPLFRSHRRSFSLPLSLESSEDVGGQPKEPLTFQMTPVTLEYIKEDSPLCATLVSLICSDELDDIEEHLEDDYFSDSSPKQRKRTQSDISLVDIRSYRYHRLTDDYPILKRHLLNLVVPLAAAEDADIIKSGDPILKFVTSNISDKVKGCMLNLHSNKEYQSCLAAILNELFTARDWKAILNILMYTFKIHLDATPELKVLMNFVISCYVMTICEKKLNCSSAESEMISQSISICHGPEQQSRAALAICKHLTLDSAINMLQMCLCNNNSSPTMHQALKTKLEELNVYSKITACAKTLTNSTINSTDSIIQITEQTVSDLNQLEQFLDWRSVQKSRPGEVLDLLIRAGEFSSCRAWANLHYIGDMKNQEIEEKYVLSLLSRSPLNSTKAFKTLEKLLKESEDVCFMTCQHLLEKVTDSDNILFITNFMLTLLSDKMSEFKLDEYRCLNMGAKALLCLPVSIQGEYEHLIRTPKLILEQLLMNTKADLACQVSKSIRYDFAKLNDDRLQLSSDHFDDLLIKYGRKAIEFAVVQVLTQDGSRSPSRGSPADIETSATPKSAFLESMRGGSSRKSVDFSALSVNRPLLSSSLGVSPKVKAFSPPSNKLIGAKFIIPAEPPPKEKWVADSAVRVCMVCQLERFSMFNRRHHCRRCGRVVCAPCSTKTSVIQGVSSRTCDDCYEQMFKPRLGYDYYQQNVKETLSYSLSPSNRAPPTSSVGSSGVPEFPAPVENITSVIRHTEHAWKLKSEEDFNILAREEFYFEQAPSASLCISILSMMSSQSKAGQVMLELCDELSKMLRPIAPGVPNPEVDYSLVISMMKHLLFQAKMNYIETGESQGLGMCDVYLSRVDLLNLLVSGNVSDIPSIQELTKVESVRRLRDRLIEDERLLLAMEVSTKCGLDTAGVWAAWGMACLHCADYTGAREKFNRCLKAPVDRNQTQQTSQLLSDIIECLETMPSSVNTDVKSLLSLPGSIKSLVNMPPLRYLDDSLLDKTQFEEGVFYLKMYGSHIAIVQFFRRHGYLMKAAQYILDKKCFTDVFVEGLFMPSLTTEDLGKLEDQLTLIDPTLEKWNVYLTATCRHLMKSRLMNVLYHVQIFMKDYIRAAMNCITYFYQRGARTYLELAGRVKHLFEAQSHLGAYLDPSKWGSVRPPSFTSHKVSWSESNNESSTVRLTQTPQEVKRYLNSVILQIEVTKYMEKSITVKPPDDIAMTIIQSYMSGQNPPPTLFGNAQVRADLVTMILLVGEDLLTSFDLSLKIIQMYKLSTVPILKHSAHEMAKFHDYPRIHQLLNCLKKTEFDDPQTVDEIIGSCIIMLKDDPAEAKEVDSLIKLLRMDSNKINSMILVGKLKSAYLLAVKSERIEDVQRISGAAQRSGQSSVQNICNKWLSQRTKKK